MRLEYIGSFADSAQLILEDCIHTPIRKGPIRLQDSFSATGISATVFMAGGVEGQMVLDLEPGLARKIAGIMNGTEFSRLDHLAIDTICELANMIIGKAVTLLNNKGFKFRTSPPCFFVGEKTCTGLESMCVSLSTEWGDAKIHTAIKDKDPILKAKGGNHA
jgi:CheY-specific phosphatase CheX